MILKRQKSKSIVDNTIFTCSIFSLFIVNCSDPTQLQMGEVIGSVMDEDGHGYPETKVKLSKGVEKIESETDSQRSFKMETKDIGSYKITMNLPLSSTAVTSLPMTINIDANQAAMVDLVIKPQPIIAHMNFGIVDIFDEINNKDGNTPTEPNELLYAANIFDAPLGLLTAIKAPDSHVPDAEETLHMLTYFQ